MSIGVRGVAWLLQLVLDCLAVVVCIEHLLDLKGQVRVLVLFTDGVRLGFGVAYSVLR